MRLYGFCEKCRRFRQVRVSSSGMAMLAARRTPVGTCASCEQAEDDKRKDRRG